MFAYLHALQDPILEPMVDATAEPEPTETAILEPMVDATAEPEPTETEESLFVDNFKMFAVYTYI